MWKGRLTHVPVIRDISGRKRAEAVVLSAKLRYQALMEQSSEALALIDLQTREIVEINRRFTEMLGWSLPEDAPLHVKQCLVESEETSDRRYDVTLTEQRTLPTEALVLRHKNSTEVYAERAGSVISIEGRDYLLSSFRDMTAERRRQAELARDAEVARRVQRDLLPDVPESPFVSIRTLYYPSRFVSGDSYYLEWRKKGKVLRGFLIDIAGHGLATALQTSSISVLLRESAKTSLSLLGQMQRTNEQSAKYFLEGSYPAMLGFELDLPAKELRYVAAGITQFHVNGRKVKTPGTFVGMWKNAEYKENIIPIAEGDTFCFLTDGFTEELEKPENASYWVADGKDVDAHVKSLEKLAESGRLRDDATGICMKITGLP